MNVFLIQSSGLITCCNTKTGIICGEQRYGYSRKTILLNTFKHKVKYGGAVISLQVFLRDFSIIFILIFLPSFIYMWEFYFLPPPYIILSTL